MRTNRHTAQLQHEYAGLARRIYGLRQTQPSHFSGDEHHQRAAMVGVRQAISECERRRSEIRTLLNMPEPVGAIPLGPARWRARG
jgi:hypothetical protein